MKKITALFFTIVALFVAIGNINAENIWSEGARYDYLDAAGNRIKSLNLDAPNYRTVNTLFSFIPWDDGIWTQPFLEVNSVVMVPWSSKNVYPLSVSATVDKDVKVSWEIVNDDETAVIASNPTEANTGSKIKFTIEVPNGTYPLISKTYSYTYPEYPFKDCAFTPYDVIPYSLPIEEYNVNDMTYRKNLLDSWMTGVGNFYRDEKNPNKWYYLAWMPNEPMSFTASCISADNTLLRQKALGISSSLYRQHDPIVNQLNNGEPFAMNMLGNCMGNDFVSNLYSFVGFDTMESGKSMLTQAFWYDYMSLISNANLTLKIMDRYDAADDNVRNYVRAEMLTLRAHAYHRLLQIYGPRWNESDNGTIPVAPLETEFATEFSAPASMLEIADQCYADLNEAIALFKSSNCERLNLVEPDINVARGVKMRIATLREDWTEAEKMAQEILDIVPKTTNEELLGGMYSATPSWIWGASNIYPDNINMLYYWAFQAQNSCNGTYPAFWQIGTNAIDRDLFLAMDKKDTRRNMFAMPEVYKSFTPYVGKLSSWYNNEMVASYDNFVGIETDSKYWTFAQANFKNRFPDCPEPFVNYIDNTEYKIKIQFGAQTKFYSVGNTFGLFDKMDVVFMRTEEAMLTLAEACCHLGKTATAAATLNELNTTRIEGCDLMTPDSPDLLDAIKLARRIELWGEGHDWFDMKRWNMPRSRRLWVAGDTESGNWPINTNTEGALTAGNGWRFAVPVSAVKANSLINLDNYKYTHVTGYEEETPAQAPEQQSSPKLEKKLIKSPQSFKSFTF